KIIATQLSKHITDHMGINFIERLQRETGASVAFIMQAYVIAESIYGMEDLWKQIEELDLKVNTAVQQKMMLQIYYLIRRATRWFLRNLKPNLLIEESINQYAKPIAELMKQLPTLLTESDKEILELEMTSLLDQGVPEVL